MVMYHPFVIRIEDQIGDAYPIVAEFQGISRSDSIPARLPLLTEQEVQQAHVWLERALIDHDYAKDLGGRLFNILFPGRILNLFREAKQRIAPTDGLRVVLNLPLPAALANLPWELTYDAQGEHGFLARSRSAPLVRHYTDAPFPNGPPEKGPLRVLVVTASPAGTAPVSVQQEVQEIVRALEKGPSIKETLRLVGNALRDPSSLSDLVNHVRYGRRFDVAPPLYQATRDQLQTRVAEAKEGFHVIHYIGHAQVDASGPVLLLQDKNGRPDPMPAYAFAEMVAQPAVNLVVLNACETAGSSSLYQSVAQEVVKRGVPAVIGMQVPVLDRTAVDFARAFYQAWAAGEPMELALAYARRLTEQSSLGAAGDWSIPVLFMGQSDSLTLQPLERVHRWLWPIRFGHRAISALIALLAAIAVLLEFPQTAQRIRTELPIIRSIYPYPMDENKFTVVFSEFAVVDETGQRLQSKDGAKLADFLFKRFELNFADLNLGLPYQLRPPSQTGAIPGRSWEERAHNAVALAEKIHANMIIHGVITDTLKGPQFAFEFYVNYRGFEEGEEITGPYALGGSLPIKLPFAAEDLSGIESPMQVVRTDILALITIGLSYYKADNPTKAFEYFTRAEQNKYWPSTDGKEIVYMLLGNAKVRQATLEESPDPVPAAQGYYEQALSISPNYARAKVGLASALYLWALRDMLSKDIIDWDTLQTAAETYEEVLALGKAQGNEQIEPRGRFGRAQVYLVRGWYDELAKRNYWLDEAQREFEWVTGQFEGGNTRIVSRAGLAYGYLGMIALLRQDTGRATELYTRAAELAPPFHQAGYYTRIGKVYCQLGQTDLAVGAYQDAIDRARLYGYPQKVEQYTSELNQLQREGCP